jgi:folate-binding protein YgfZ
MSVRTLVLHPDHDAAGADFAETASWLLPATYRQSFHDEYRAAREGAAVVDLSDRAVLAVSGPPRQKFLQGILSNDVERKPGQGCPAALMTARGHLRALLRVLVGRDAVWLECPPDRLEVVEQALAHYRVATPVRFEPRPVAVLAILGPGARRALASAGVELPEMAAEDHVERTLAGATVTVVRAGDLPGEGYVLHLADDAASVVWRALLAAGATPLGRRALDTLRVEAGRPWYGSDVTEENLLHETGLVGQYHSPTKGCYVGQEVIARLDARGGNVNKMLRGLRLGAAAGPGAPVTAGGEILGRVTTAALSPRFGPIAIGYVHRSHFAPGTAVEVEGRPATVVALPFEDPR